MPFEATWRRRRGLAATAFGCCLSLFMPRIAAAEVTTGPAGLQAPRASYPLRPVRLILPAPPGGGTDVVARTLAQKLSEALGQPFIVENKPGGSGTVGGLAVARAAPDGYTLMISASVHLINALILTQVPYDAVGDFTPITQIAEVPLLTVAYPSAGIASLQDLAHAPGERSWNWAIAALGSPDHLVAESLRDGLGAKLNIVPYRGLGPAIADTVGGQVSGMSSPVLSVIAYVRDGRLRPLAVSSAKRNMALPAVPTLAESGMEGFVMSSWYGLWGPRGLSPAISHALADAARRGFQDPDISVRFPPESFEIIGSSPEAFGQLIERETARYAKIVRAAGISADKL